MAVLADKTGVKITVPAWCVPVAFQQGWSLVRMR